MVEILIPTIMMAINFQEAIWKEQKPTLQVNKAEEF